MPFRNALVQTTSELIPKTRLGVAIGWVLLATLPAALGGCSAEADAEATPGAGRETLCAGVTLNASTPSPSTIGTQITLSASASCDPGAVEFEFAFRPSPTSAWTILQPFGAASSVLWNTSGLVPASYALRARARNAGSTLAGSSTTNHVLGTASPCAGAVLVPNQAYATHAANVVDLHLPTGVSGSRPLIVWIHGGYWSAGSKTLETAARNRLCPRIAQGFAVASVDYRLTCIPPTCAMGDPESCEDHLFPKQIHDVKAAVRFLRARAASFRIAPNRFVAWGASAGGHLAALLGTSSGVAALDDPTQGNSAVSSHVQGFIDCYGPIRFDSMDVELEAAFPGRMFHHSDACSAESQLLGCNDGLDHPNCDAQLSAASPMTHVDPDDPPALIAHGTSDTTVPLQQSEQLEQALLSAGVQVKLERVTGGTHGIASSCPSESNIDEFLAGLFP
jgi:acetyl esterase/lipase